jgi:hypothetical protein
MKYIVLERKRRKGTDVLRASLTRFSLSKLEREMSEPFHSEAADCQPFRFLQITMSELEMNWSS